MFTVLLAVAYLLGAIPFAVLVGRAMRGVDVRRSGSGNTGAMNTLKTAGPFAGVLVGVLDATKGVLAVIAGRWLIGPEAGALAGCFAVIGHCFSPYMILTSNGILDNGWKRALRKTGGKGLATGVGVLLAVAWPVALFAVAVFGLLLLILRKDETVPSILSALVAAPAIWFLTHNAVVTVAVLFVGIVIAVKHLPDLREAFWVDGQE